MSAALSYRDDGSNLSQSLKLPLTGKKKVKLGAAMATGATQMWLPLIESALARAAAWIPEGSRVLEIGYGNGMLACYVTQRYGWNVTGYDILEEAWHQARYNAAAHGLLQAVDFRTCKPEETFQLTGSYDAVMIKTVLYNASTLEEYGRWLDWILSVLKVGAVLINWENGRGNASVYWYRKLRGRYYADLCMYDSRIEALYRERFENLQIEYTGGYAWPLAGTPLFTAISRLEDQHVQRTADNSFAVGLTGRKPQG